MGAEDRYEPFWPCAYSSTSLSRKAAEDPECALGSVFGDPLVALTDQFTGFLQSWGPLRLGSIEEHLVF